MRLGWGSVQIMPRFELFSSARELVQRLYVGGGSVIVQFKRVSWGNK
jgi:hypothetical protein